MGSSNFFAMLKNGKMGIKDFYKDKVIIVTGASSGIGRALAIEGAKLGAKIVLAARREEALKEVVKEIESLGGEALAVKTDVSSYEQCQNLAKAAVDKFGKIDILINNAGISMRAIFEEMKIEVFEKLMNINFMGTMYCTHAAINHILKQKGSVVGISSIAGLAPLPARTAYSASKYAMFGFLATLRVENRKKGLHVLIAHPGFTESEIRKRALTKDGTPQSETPRAEEKMMTAEEVAIKVLKAIKKRKPLLVLTTTGKLTYWLYKMFPNLMEGVIYNAMKKEPDSPLK
jgi:short-subunit dehydrogenase